MKKISASDISEMSVEQRMELVEDLWDSIAALPESVTVPEWHKAELERRLEAYHANSGEGSPWQDVKNRLIGG